MISLQVQTKSACQHALFMLRGETKSAEFGTKNVPKFGTQKFAKLRRIATSSRNVWYAKPSNWSLVGDFRQLIFGLQGYT